MLERRNTLFLDSPHYQTQDAATYNVDYSVPCLSKCSSNQDEQIYVSNASSYDFCLVVHYVSMIIHRCDQIFPRRY